MLVLEDLHWADGDTQAVVDYLVDHIDDSRLMLLVTMRDSESPVVAEMVTHWSQ